MDPISEVFYRSPAGNVLVSAALYEGGTVAFRSLHADTREPVRDDDDKAIVAEAAEHLDVVAGLTLLAQELIGLASSDADGAITAPPTDGAELVKLSRINRLIVTLARVGGRMANTVGATLPPVGGGPDSKGIPLSNIGNEFANHMLACSALLNVLDGEAKDFLRRASDGTDGSDRITKQD